MTLKTKQKLKLIFITVLKLFVFLQLHARNYTLNRFNSWTNTARYIKESQNCKYMKYDILQI